MMRRSKVLNSVMSPLYRDGKSQTQGITFHFQKIVFLVVVFFFKNNNNHTEITDFKRTNGKIVFLGFGWRICFPFLLPGLLYEWCITIFCYLMGNFTLVYESDLHFWPARRTTTTTTQNIVRSLYFHLELVVAEMNVLVFLWIRLVASGDSVVSNPVHLWQPPH